MLDILLIFLCLNEVSRLDLSVIPQGSCWCCPVLYLSLACTAWQRVTSPYITSSPVLDSMVETVETNLFKVNCQVVLCAAVFHSVSGSDYRGFESPNIILGQSATYTSRGFRKKYDRHIFHIVQCLSTHLIRNFPAIQAKMNFTAERPYVFMGNKSSLGNVIKKWWK